MFGGVTADIGMQDSVPALTGRYEFVPETGEISKRQVRRLGLSAAVRQIQAVLATDYTIAAIGQDADGFISLSRSK